MITYCFKQIMAPCMTDSASIASRIKLTTSSYKCSTFCVMLTCNSTQTMSDIPKLFVEEDVNNMTEHLTCLYIPNYNTVN
jgi:hypothetical protein